MPKFFSIPGMSPSGGEGGMNAGPQTQRRAPTREDLQRQYPAYFKYADREELGGSFAKRGDHFDIHGDRAVVEHVEHNQDGSQDLTVIRDTQHGSGTYKVKVEEVGGQCQAVTKIKPTFD